MKIAIAGAPSSGKSPLAAALGHALQVSGRQAEVTVATPPFAPDLARHDLPLSDFLIAVDRGEVVACGALWDQRGFRQTVIRDYSPLLRAARPLVNAAHRLIGTPRLPAVGSTLAMAFLSPLAVAPGADLDLGEFIEAFFIPAAQRGLEYLTIALPVKDPRLPALQRRFSTRSWHSRLYQVMWPGQSEVDLQDAPCLPDVALL